MRGGLGIGVPQPAPSAFVPPHLSGCVLWLRADMGITLVSGAVSAWADQSGSGNHVTQGTAGSRPAYASNGGPNDAPYVQFDGTDDHLHAAAFALDQPTEIFVVATPSPSRGAGAILDGEANGSMLVRSNINAIVIDAGTELAAAGVDVQLWGRFRCLFDGVASEAQVGDAAAVTGDAGAADGDGLYVGTDGGNAARGDPLIAEIVIFNRELSAAERSLVNQYLKGRYAL